MFEFMLTPLFFFSVFGVCGFAILSALFVSALQEENDLRTVLALVDPKYFVAPELHARATAKKVAPRREVDLSIIIPAFDETERLPIMLKETLDYLKSRSVGVKYKLLPSSSSPTFGYTKEKLRGIMLHCAT